MSVWDDLKLTFPDNTDGFITAETMRDQVDTLELVDSDNIKGASVQVIVKNPEDTDDIAVTVFNISDATTDKRYVITLNAGKYTTVPVVMKPFIFIQGEPGVTIEPNSVSDTMFTMSDDSTLYNVQLNGATSGIGMSYTGTGSCEIHHVTTYDCDTGLFINTTGTIHAHSMTFAGTGTFGVNCIGGELTMNNPVIEGQSTYTTFVSISGANTIGTTTGILSTSSNVTNGIALSGGAEVLLNTPGIMGATYGITVTGDTLALVKGGQFFRCDYGGYFPDEAGSPNIEFSGTSALDSVVFDLFWMNPRATIIGLGTADLTKAVMAEGIAAIGLVVDTQESDAGCQILGELKVGTPLLPSETCMGEGDSYASTLVTAMYTYDGSSYVDVTAELSSPSGSAVALPNTAVNSAFYFTSTIEKDGDVLKIPGFKYSCTQAATSASGNSPFVVEYYNGSVWVELTSMTSDAGDSYQSVADRIFEEAGVFQTRLNAYLQLATWSVFDPMAHGTPYYWIRIRTIETLTQVPILEQVKVHSNRTEINTDGFIEFFGKARPFKALPWDSGLLTATGNNPVGSHLYVSDNLDRLLVGNLFRNLDSDSVGFNTYLPNDVDTSTPINIRVGVTSTVGSADVASFVVRWGWTSDGDNVYDNTGDAPTTGPNEQSSTIDLTMPATPDTQTSFIATLDIAMMLPAKEVGAGDMLWVSIERPIGDAHAGDVSLINLSAEYVTYVLGGHI